MAIRILLFFILLNMTSECFSKKRPKKDVDIPEIGSYRKNSHRGTTPPKTTGKTFYERANSRVQYYKYINSVPHCAAHRRNIHNVQVRVGYGRR